MVMGAMGLRAGCARGTRCRLDRWAFFGMIGFVDEIRLRTCTAKPEPTPVPPAGLTAAHFRGAVTRWTPDGVRAVDLSVPPEVERLAAQGEPAAGWCGAYHHMTPARWPQSEEPAQIPSLWCLREARVYGGANTARWPDAAVEFGGWHREGQLVLTADHELIPASYCAIDGSRSLPDGLVRPGDVGLLLAEPGEPRRLDGVHVLLGNIQPHFGHMLLEGLGRAWGRHYLDPELPLRWLVYEPRISPFAARLLKLAGIPATSIERASPHDVVERLVVPDLGMRSHRWITTAQGLAWDLVARPAPPTERVYLSRRNARGRRCTNEDRVEAMFAEAGWTIVRPEDLKIREQVELAGRARGIAGCAGSQLYLSAFQPPRGQNILIAPRNFLLRDDLLIASLRSHRTAVALGSAVDFDTEERTWEADLDAVRAVLESSSGPRRSVTQRVRAAFGPARS